MHWFKRLGISFALLTLGFVVFLRLQVFQYAAAYLGPGFARSLPVPAAFADKRTCTTQPLSVMSFNVMYGSATIEALANRFRGGKTTADFLPWSQRLPEIRERIASYSPDLLGLQEMETDADIRAIAPSGQFGLVTYHLGDFQYGDAALLYKISRFEPLDSGQLWLGPNPELPMSLGFSPLAMLRYVNWALLRDKASGFTFIYANTHFDNASKNKDPSANLFRERIASLAKGLPVVVTGDFNTNANTERYFRLIGANEPPPLLTNVFELIKQPVVDNMPKPDKLIDHILAGGPCVIEAEQWLVDTRPLKSGQPMSDHHLVFAKIRFSDTIALAAYPGLE